MIWSSKSHVPLVGSFNRIEVDDNENIIIIPGTGKKIGMNVAVPTAKVHLAAGESGSGLGPLKFTVAGTALLTAPEVGVLEPMTDDLYYTITTGIARKPIVMTDGFPLTAGRVPYATTNGRLTDSDNLTNDGTSINVNINLKVLEGFGCNGAAVQPAYVSGGALAAYGAGANGLDSGANMAALHALVVSIRAALVANGILS